MQKAEAGRRLGFHMYYYIGLLSIGNRYIVNPMATTPIRSDSLGKNPGVSALILSSLAGGEKHGYALVKDVAEFAGVGLTN
jgi:hypothetical protein